MVMLMKNSLFFALLQHLTQVIRLQVKQNCVDFIKKIENNGLQANLGAFFSKLNRLHANWKWLHGMVRFGLHYAPRIYNSKNGNFIKLYQKTIWFSVISCGYVFWGKKKLINEIIINNDEWHNWAYVSLSDFYSPEIRTKQMPWLTCCWCIVLEFFALKVHLEPKALWMNPIQDKARPFLVIHQIHFDCMEIKWNF